MKKILFSIVALFVFNVQSLNAQAIHEGSVLVDAYYGFPNLYTSVYKGLYANSGSELNVNIGSAGPLGLRAEYLISDKVGFGLDLGFNSTTISYDSQTYDASLNPITYNYKYSTRKIGALVSFNYHFVEDDNFDAYFVVGMGYGSRSFDVTSNDPTMVKPNWKSVVPVASKIGVGMRYFFTENIGANFALGLGQGGIINVGLSAKF
jgi:outer membrane protein W